MFIECCYRFLEHLHVFKNASEHTIRSYATDLNSFKSYWEKELYTELKPMNLPTKIDPSIPYTARQRDKDHLLNLEAIDRKTIRGFLAWLYSNGKSKPTGARRLSTLRSFFKYAQSQKLIVLNPTDDLEHAKLDKKLPPSLTYEQISHLFNQPDVTCWLGHRDRAIMELFYSSGLRVSELVSLNIEDIDSARLMMKLKGKGKKERITPITKNAAQWIDSYLAHPERQQIAPTEKAVFLNKNGGRLTTRSVDRNFELYLKNSGLAGKVTPHTIRHTIATHWLENGMSLKIIQALLGHSALATTTIYTQVSTKLKRQVYNETHPRA
jgi:integrase/recombinase XerC